MYHLNRCFHDSDSHCYLLTVKHGCTTQLTDNKQYVCVVRCDIYTAMHNHSQLIHAKLTNDYCGTIEQSVAYVPKAVICLTCITGGMAQAFYGGVPEHIAGQALSYLDDELILITVGFFR